MLPGTLEWHYAAVIIALMSFVLPHAWIAAAVMIALSVVVAAGQAMQSPLSPEDRHPKSLLLVAFLCYAQPLVRSWHRYRVRLLPPPTPIHDKETQEGVTFQLPAGDTIGLSYWDEEWRERTDLLERVTRYFTEHNWAPK